MVPHLGHFQIQGKTRKKGCYKEIPKKLGGEGVPPPPESLFWKPARQRVNVTWIIDVRTNVTVTVDSWPIGENNL